MGNLVQFTTQYGCSMENAMSFLTKIAEAVTFLHNRRFIHCDLRAEAISIYYNGDVSQVLHSGAWKAGSWRSLARPRLLGGGVLTQHV